jgi:DNA-binding XRE family transcriptional regulator
MKTSELTLGEKLKIDRRRRGESQKEAAKRWEVTLYRYRQIETDEISKHPGIRPALRVIRPHERCYILRMREDVSVAVMAKRLGVSEWWFIQMEHGREDAGKLVEHWAA